MKHRLPGCLSLLFIFYSINAFGQLPGERGIELNLGKGIVKTVAEIVAYEKAHPMASNSMVPFRPELDGPIPMANDPFAIKSSRTGGAGTPLSLLQPAATQTLFSNFLAIWGSYSTIVPGRESGSVPPDNCGDVGLTQVVATANTRLKSFLKPPVTEVPSVTPTGSSTTTLPAIANFDLDALFASTSLGITRISDPHIRFDRLSRRWFLVAIDVNHTANNYICVAVSSGEAITSSASFTIYYFNAGSTGGLTTDFMDYPTLGVDKFSLNIGSNTFQNSTNFTGSNMWVINKQNLISGTLTITSFPHNQYTTDIYTPQGVHNDDPQASAGFFIGVSQTYYSRLVIKRINYTGSTASLSSDLILSTIITYTPKDVPTLGGTTIDAGDRRLYAAMIKKNKITGTSELWTTQASLVGSTGIGGSGGDRDAAVWFKIGTLSTTPTIMQSGTLADVNTAGSSVVYYVYPSIATSGQGHSIMGFTSAGPTKYPQASAAGRYRSDAAGTLQPSIDMTNATSGYNPSENRWGDFTQTVVDPEDDMTMWTFSQYAPATNSWGVRAGQFKAPPPPVLSSPVPTCGTSTITITGTSSNHEEFFDPGDDPGGPGFNRLKVSLAGPTSLAISNVRLISPTQVQADVDVPTTTASGNYLLTVTNPDGQSTSMAMALNDPCANGAPSAITLSGAFTNGNVNLNWTTSDASITSFVVEKSYDGITFQLLQEVNGAGNAALTSYSAVDKAPFPGYSYYRLKINMASGSFFYSNTVKVQTEEKAVALIMAYPNPTNNEINFELVVQQESSLVIEAVDMAGKKVLSEQVRVVAGINNVVVGLRRLASGAYLIRFTNNTNEVLAKTRIVRL